MCDACDERDWVEDESLTAEETLARFAALHPEPTTGPRTYNPATTYYLEHPGVVS